MANLVKSQLIPLVIPSKGMSTRFPLAAMPPEYSPWIADFDNEGGVYESRRGVKWKFNASINYISAIQPHPTDKNKIVILDTSGTCRLQYYDVVTDARADIGTVVAVATNPRALSVSFNKRAYFFPVNRTPTVYDGTTYSLVGYTGPTMTNIAFGFPYKSRMYLIPQNSTSVWYGTIGGVTGPTKEVDFASLIQDAGTIMCAFSFTLSSASKTFSGSSAESLFALVFDTGEMLVFSGNYPDDVTSWNLVASPRISSPLSYQSIIEFNGDVLVLTTTGIVSCRQLLTNSTGDNNAATITFEIQKYWTQFVNYIRSIDAPPILGPNSRVSYINGCYHTLRDKIVIFFPNSFNPNPPGQVGYSGGGGNTALVYDVPTKSWVVHMLGGLTGGQLISSYYSPIFGKLIFGTNATGGTGGESAWEYWGRDDQRDEPDPISFSIYTPSIQTAFVSMNYQTLIKQVFVTHETLFGKANAIMNIVGDSGEFKSGNQRTTTKNGNSVSRDLFDFGITAENFQIVITTITDIEGSMTKPYKLISISPVIEPTKSVFG